jgi:hypothetical protein
MVQGWSAAGVSIRQDRVSGSGQGKFAPGHRHPSKFRAPKDRTAADPFRIGTALLLRA